MIREGEDASTARAQFDWVNMLLCYIRKLESAPMMENNLGALDLFRVESCYAAVLDRLGQAQDKAAGLAHVNLIGDQLTQ